MSVSDRKCAVDVVSEVSVLVRFVHLLVTYFHTEASTDNVSSWAKKYLILLPTPSPTPSLPVEAKKVAGTRLRARDHCCSRQGTESPRQRMNSQLPNNREGLSPTGPSLPESQGALFISWQSKIGTLEVFFCLL